MRRRARATVLRPALAAVLLLWAGLAVAQRSYEAAFRDGLSALDQKKWAVAAASLREAIEANPIEGGKRIRVYGTWLLDYLPHYYLGVALYQLGDVEGAAAAWRESRSQGVILGTPLRAELERWQQQLPAPEPEPVAAPPPKQAATPPPAPASAPAVTTPSPPAAPPVVAAPSPAELAQLLLAPARLYFDGRYRETLSALRGTPGRGSARRALGDCPTPLGTARPDPRLFSPAFSRWFEQHRQAAASASR